MIQSKACFEATIQSEGEASHAEEKKREGVDMPNKFNRKTSPKPPFSRPGKRHVEERRERAPWGESRASPIPCAESTGASVHT
jgi:hypothetical protein